MNNYIFYKEYSDDKGRVTREEINLDNNIKKYQYLPYLNYIDSNLVDEYNKFVLKRKFAYYDDKNNSNLYLTDQNRLINYDDKLLNYKSIYNDLINLINNLHFNFDKVILMPNIDKTQYYIYKKIYTDNLTPEILRLYNVILYLESNKLDYIDKKYNINYIIFTLFVVFILFFIIYNLATP